jgi:hypothetical protein
MEWFSYKAKFNKNNELDFGENGAWIDSNFNTFLEAFLTVFSCLTGDNWSQVYAMHYVAAGPLLSTLFFLTLIIVGFYILLMLFVAILVENFEEDSINQEQ